MEDIIFILKEYTNERLQLISALSQEHDKSNQLIHMNKQLEENLKNLLHEKKAQDNKIKLYEKKIETMKTKEDNLQSKITIVERELDEFKEANTNIVAEKQLLRDAIIKRNLKIETLEKELNDNNFEDWFNNNHSK